MLSSQSSSHVYGIGIITIMVGISVSIIFYQMYYLPESFAKPAVAEHILNPIEQTNISMILGSANPDQQDNFVPKLVNIQLGIDNHVIWINDDDTPHTVTPDHSIADSYSGPFGSSGVVKAGEKYEFLFTESYEIEYHCEPHPWLTGTLIVTKQRF